VSLNVPLRIIMFSLAGVIERIPRGRPRRPPVLEIAFLNATSGPGDREYDSDPQPVNETWFKCSLTKKCLCHSNLRADFRLGVLRCLLCYHLPNLGKGMPGVAPTRPRYRFGPFELDTGEDRLRGVAPA